MTLILSWLSPSTVVQSSDTRLSYGPNTKDIARKCLFYESLDARLSIAYTGLAEFIERKGTEAVTIEDWICSQVSGLPDGAQLESVVESLTTGLHQVVSATETFWPLSERETCLSVILAGFWKGNTAPTIVCISNYEVLGHLIVAASSSENHLHQISPKKNESFTSGKFTATVTWFVGDGPRILAHGNLTAIDRSLANRLNRIARKIHRRRLGYQAMRTCLVDAIRTAADHHNGQNIGKDCWSYSMFRDNPVHQFEHHFQSHSPLVATPRMIGPGLRVDAWVAEGSVDELVEKYKQDMEGGNYRIDINEHSLRAYIQKSPRFEWWLRCLQALHVQIGEIGLIHRDIEMLHKAGLKSLDQVDEMLMKSEGWGRDFLQAYVLNQLALHRRIIGGSCDKKNFSVDKNAILSLLAVANWPEIFADQFLAEKFAPGFADQVKSLARQSNPKYKRSG